MSPSIPERNERKSFFKLFVSPQLKGDGYGVETFHVKISLSFKKVDGEEFIRVIGSTFCCLGRTNFHGLNIDFPKTESKQA